VLVAGGADESKPAGAGSFESIRRQIDARLGVKTDTVDLQRIARFSDRIAADPSLANVVAPLVGALAGVGTSAQRV
jgi:hypothetical protein